MDALAFETLTPKAIIQRYVSLLLEHKRVIFNGPTGAGKTFMALRIANFVVNKSKKESVATFAVQRNNVPEMKDFLQRMCNIKNEDGTNVIILDNLTPGDFGEYCLCDHMPLSKEMFDLLQSKQVSP